MNNQFSQNLKKIRKEHNLSQEQLADELGVSRQAISKWESATSYPEMDKIIDLCNKFNVNIDDLLQKDIKEVKKEEENKKGINKIIDDFLRFLTDTVNLFSRMSFKSKLKCLFEQIIIVGILFLISTIFIASLNELFLNVFGIFPYKFTSFIVYGLIDFVLIIFCLVSSIIIITHIFKNRYLDYFKKNEKEENDDEKINLKKENKIIIRDPKHSEYSFINLLFKFIIFIIKFWLILLGIFIGFILIWLLAFFIMSFLVYKTGIFFIGLMLVDIAGIIFFLIILLLILNFIFNRQNAKKKVIYSLIIAICLFGVGLGLSFVGSLNFKLASFQELTQTQSQEIVMSNNKFFSNIDNIKYIEKDTRNILLEYKVNKYCNVEIREQENEKIHLITYCDNPFKITKEILKNLNAKKIISINDELYDIKVYANKENIEILKRNKEEYLKRQEMLENNETLEETDNY